MRQGGAQAEPSASLLFRARTESGSGIPLTADFQAEYARVAQESRLRKPSALRKAYRFLPADFSKFLAPESLSPEILRVADRKPGGNPLRGKEYVERDRKWCRVAELSRTSMRLAAYGGAVSNLLAQADEFRVSWEDRQELISALLAISEAMWSQATRTALYSSRQRRTMALQAMGFPPRDADQIGKTIPYEGPYLFGGRAIQVFDDECEYRKRADETAARFHQSRKPWTGPPRRDFPAQRPAGRQVTVTVPGPAPEPRAGRGRGRSKPAPAYRRGGQRSHRGAPKGGQGF